jgi:hypothetical protein
MKRTDWLALLFALPQSAWAQQQPPSGSQGPAQPAQAPIAPQGPIQQQGQFQQQGQNSPPGQGTSPQAQGTQQQTPMQQGPSQQQYSPQGQSQQGSNSQWPQQQWPQQWQGQSAAPAPAVPTASGVAIPPTPEQVQTMEKIDAIQTSSLELRARRLAGRAAREADGLDGVEREIASNQAMKDSTRQALSKRVAELFDDVDAKVTLTKAEDDRLKREDADIQDLLAKLGASQLPPSWQPPAR